MKKCAVVLIFMLLISGCEKRKITAFENGFKGFVDITANGNMYSYNAVYKTDGTAQFIATENTYLSYVFSVSEKMVQYQGLSVTATDAVLGNSLCYILWHILNSNKYTEVLPDYNGIYCIYGTDFFGQYKLYLKDNGVPQKADVEKYGAVATFNCAKE